jgi:hypothetical protein
MNMNVNTTPGVGVSFMGTMGGVGGGQGTGRGMLSAAAAAATTSDSDDEDGDYDMAPPGRAGNEEEDEDARYFRERRWRTLNRNGGLLDSASAGVSGGGVSHGVSEYPRSQGHSYSSTAGGDAKGEDSSDSDDRRRIAEEMSQTLTRSALLGGTSTVGSANAASRPPPSQSQRSRELLRVQEQRAEAERLVMDALELAELER